MKLSQFQQTIAGWMYTCFGPRISEDSPERNFRFFEEATELVQSGGMSRADAHSLVDYVYDRPVGVLPQEVGGVMVTLAALCQAHRVDLELAAVDEMRRIHDPAVMNKIRAKQATKPHRSPLPGNGITVVTKDEALRVLGIAQRLRREAEGHGPLLFKLGNPTTPTSERIKRLFERDQPGFEPEKKDGE